MGLFRRIFSFFYYHSYLKLCTKNVSQLVVETDYKLYPLVLKHCFIVVVFFKLNILFGSEDLKRDKLMHTNLNCPINSHIFN